MINKELTTYPVKTFKCINMPDYVKSCEYFIDNEGKVFLQWEPKENGFNPTGEAGYFLSERACKMYISKEFGIKSKWEEIETI